MSEFPQDLLEEVLLMSGLPAEELVKLRQVSKAWKATIENPYFIKRHLKISSSSTRILLVDFKSYRTFQPQKLCTPSGSVDSLEEAYTAKLPLPYCSRRSVTVFVSGSCNGLVCLALYSIWYPWKPAVVLWNPSSNQRFKLPSSPIKCGGSGIDRRYSHGFGYDDVHDDYKVVRLAQFYHPLRQCVEIFSLKSNSWRSLPELGPYVLSNRFPMCYKGVLARGSLHWCMTDDAVDDNSNRVIIALDLATEKHRLIFQPDGTDSMKIDQFTALDDSLFLMVSENSSFYGEGHVWVMMEYGVRESWTKICTVFNWVKPMAYLHKKFIVFLDLPSLRLFDTETECFEKSIQDYSDGADYYTRAYSYIPSLVRLPTKKTALARLKQRIRALFAAKIRSRVWTD